MWKLHFWCTCQGFRKLCCIHYGAYEYYQRGYLTQEDDSSRNYLVVRFYKIYRHYNQNTVEKTKIMWNLQTLSTAFSAEWRFETKIVCHAGKRRTPLNTLSEFAFNTLVLSPYAYESRWLSVGKIIMKGIKNLNCSGLGYHFRLIWISSRVKNVCPATGITIICPYFTSTFCWQHDAKGFT